MALNAQSSQEAKDRSLRFWGGLVPTSEQRAADQAATRQRIYDNTAHKTLADYASAPVRSKWLPTPQESDMGFLARVQGWLQHLSDQLPAAEYEAVAAAVSEARQRMESGEYNRQKVRDHLEARSSGTGVGMLPDAASRAAIVGSRFGGEAPQANGHLAGQASNRLNLVGNGATQVSLSLLDRMPKAEPPAFARPQIPAGISGEGWR